MNRKFNDKEVTLHLLSKSPNTVLSVFSSHYYAYREEIHVKERPKAICRPQMSLKAAMYMH